MNNPPESPERNPQRFALPPGLSSEASLHLLDYWNVLRLRMWFIIIIVAVVLATAGFLTWSAPREYASSATMQIRNRDQSMRLFGGMSETQGVDPRFLTTQFEIIQRKEVLYPVIQTLNLQTQWNAPTMEAAYRKLRTMLRVREVRNTQLIDIVVLSPDPMEAAMIANTVADEYARRRHQEESDRVEDSLKQLREEVEKQRVVVDEKFRKMTQIREALGIRDLTRIVHTRFGRRPNRAPA